MKTEQIRILEAAKIIEDGIIKLAGFDRLDNLIEKLPDGIEFKVYTQHIYWIWQKLIRMTSSELRGREADLPFMLVIAKFMQKEKR